MEPTGPQRLGYTVLSKPVDLGIITDARHSFYPETNIPGLINTLSTALTEQREPLRFFLIQSDYSKGAYNERDHYCINNFRLNGDTISSFMLFELLVKRWRLIEDTDVRVKVFKIITEVLECEASRGKSFYNEWVNVWFNNEVTNKKNFAPVQN